MNLKRTSKLLLLIFSWVIICILPILILWPEYILENRIEQQQINSFLLVSAEVILINFFLFKLSQYPGKRGVQLIFSVISITTIFIFSIIVFFHLTYSIYQLTFSAINTILFYIYIELNFEKKIIMAYIPIGRCKTIPRSQDVEWVKLTRANHDEVTKNISAIVVDLSSNEINDEWKNFLAMQAINQKPIYNYIQINESLTGKSPIQHLHENNLGALQPSQSYSFFKRILDMFLIFISLPIVLPLMIFVSILIKFESKGDILFVQNRIGQGGRVFKMYKFRSMKVDAPNQNIMMTQLKDARITKVGRIIRKLRIDELPQFLNVLKGDMSLIGPRPELPSEVVRLEKEIPFYIYRQIVKPGISGWAQVMQGEGHVENIQTKLEYDFYYIKNFSFTLDFLIVIKTLKTMVTGFGAR